jgi:hypothetical protein
MQFIGYHIDGYDTDKTVPISTGETFDEAQAQAQAIRRTLSACILDGQIGVQQRDDVDPETFAQLKASLDAWFKGKGIDV